MLRSISEVVAQPLATLVAVAVSTASFLALSAQLDAQRGQGRGRGPDGPPPTAQAAAPIDLTGYWVSMIVDEWRFRVSPQKGDILYLPLNQEARQLANAWDPAKDEAEGKQCKAYGAIGAMQRPGRLQVSWQDANTLKLELDAGTQTRLLHFTSAPPDKGPPTWQGYSVANWQVLGRNVIDTGGQGLVAAGRQNRTAQGGNLNVVTTNLLPGYIRKNGVPHSEKAVLTEYFNRLTGQDNDVFLSVTAMVEDPTYLTQPFVRSYQFKKLQDASGWDPTPCWNR
ncbi:MAG: hypothetical protein C5B57_01025 [Blastocatellia bacterium]|nr:MAG: hypothetical protein C5B57_01025 [Blastocatellia bacterium]